MYANWFNPVVTLIAGIDIDESGYFIEDIRINKIIELQTDFHRKIIEN